MSILTSKKQCTKCGEWKDRGEFYKDKNRKDGLFSHCKACKLSDWAAYRAANPERVREIARKSSAKRSLKPERQAYFKKWYSENKERVYQKVREYVTAHPEQRHKTIHKYIDNNTEKVRANTRNWFKKNPAKAVEYRHNRRAKVQGNGGTFTAQEWVDLCAKYGNKCIVPGCNRTDLTPDHVIPLDKGGSNSIDNIQPLCGSHNYRKHTKIIDYR